MENKSSNGTLILVLGIMSIACAYPLGPFAWIMGNRALANGVHESERGIINAGRICGIVGTALTVLIFGSMIVGMTLDGTLGRLANGTQSFWETPRSR